MVKDLMQNAALYKGLSPAIARVFDFVSAHNWEEMNLGRYDLSDGLYINYTKGPMKAWQAGVFEAHKAYLDIHFVLKGGEVIGHTDISLLVSRNDYDPERDIYFLDGEGDPITLHEGEFMIVYPHDAHKPLIRPDFYAGESVKLVAKIRMDLI